MRAVVVCVLLLLGCVVPASASTCAPTALEHVVVTAITPGIVLGSFAAQPLSVYRLGNGKMRSEETPDPANHIHGLIVTAEPDTWMVNLDDGTGKHIVDQGPTFNAVVPLFGTTSYESKFSDLQLGCEAQFVAAHPDAAKRVELIGGVAFDAYRMVIGDDAVEILDRAGTATPAYARFLRSGKLLVALRYDLYQTGLPTDPQLFVAPTGITYAP